MEELNQRRNALLVLWSLQRTHGALRDSSSNTNVPPETRLKQGWQIHGVCSTPANLAPMAGTTNRSQHSLLLSQTATSDSPSRALLEDVTIQAETVHEMESVCHLFYG